MKGPAKKGPVMSRNTQLLSRSLSVHLNDGESGQGEEEYRPFWGSSGDPWILGLNRRVTASWAHRVGF